MKLNLDAFEKTKDPIHISYLRLAYQVAWSSSPDPSTKTGAVIDNPDLGIIVSVGWNHLKPGVSEDVLETSEKYPNMIHAEEDSVSRLPENLYDVFPLDIEWTMHMEWTPCEPCKDAILSVLNLKTYVAHWQMLEKNSEGKWTESCNRALYDMADHGIRILAYDGKIGDVKAISSREIWHP